MTTRERRSAAALLFVVLNLRLAVAAIPPVLSEIERDVGLSSATAGLLTAAPVVCFGAVALLTPSLLRRIPISYLLLATLAVLALGCAIRLDPSPVALFGGTVVVGAGIAVANVLVPGLVKREHPRQAAMMIGLCSVGISLSGAIGAGLTVPLEHLLGGGWRPAVALWGVGALVAIVLWLPQSRRAASVAAPAEPAVGRALWHDRLAWAVTLFMGLQSLAFYAVLNWLPTLFEDDGMSRGKAGWLLSLAFFLGMGAAFATPIVQRRVRWQPTMVLALALLWAGGYLGLIFAAVDAPFLWVTLIGLGQGTALSLGLGFIVARSPDGHHAAHLSTMAQGVGYLIGATGPFAVGALHGITSGWTAPLIFLLVVLVPLTAAGFAACRPGHVLDDGTEVSPLDP